MQELGAAIGAMGVLTSGQTAVLLSLLNICNAGDSFYQHNGLTEVSVNLFSIPSERLGIEWYFLDLTELDVSLSWDFLYRNIWEEGIYCKGKDAAHA